MAANADIFLERDDWRKPLAWSAALHCALFGSIAIYAVVIGGWHGSDWGTGGTGGGAMSATLVSTIPLPANPVQTQSVLANESKGLTQSVPKTKEEPTPEAIPIPEQNAKKKPKKEVVSESLKRPFEPAQEVSSVVPYGEGGPVTSMYGFNAGGAKGGFNVSGSGGGDFGSHYGWYVDVVKRKVSENWLKYEIDPHIAQANRCYITFDITRSGQPANIRVEQSSGVPSLDISAMRALQRIDSFGPLPSDYSGSKVSVEFFFDYHR